MSEERAHYAEGVANLAIEQRDQAENALQLVVEYDELLKHWGGEAQVLLEGDISEVDAAYDKMVAAALSAIAHDGEPTGSARQKIDLWFFRDLSDDQRLKLFDLFGLPSDEIGKMHAMQRHALRRVIRSLSTPISQP